KHKTNTKYNITCSNTATHRSDTRTTSDPPAQKSNAMPKQKPSDQVATLRRQQAELIAKLKEAETKARQEEKEIQRRKNELAGAVALKELEANPSGAFAVALGELLRA